MAAYRDGLRAGRAEPVRLRGVDARRDLAREVVAVVLDQPARRRDHRDAAVLNLRLTAPREETRVVALREARGVEVADRREDTVLG